MTSLAVESSGEMIKHGQPLMCREELKTNLKDFWKKVSGKSNI